jgi:hypothetical protein
MNFFLHQSLMSRTFLYDQEDIKEGMTCEKDLSLSKTLWTHPDQIDDLFNSSR